jgi:hypothetical protein
MPTNHKLLVGVALGVALGPVAGFVAADGAPPGDQPPNAPSSTGQCGTEGKEPCIRRVYGWGGDCDASTTDTYRQLCSILDPPSPADPPPAGSADPIAADPNRSRTPLWMTIGLAGLAGIGVGSSFAARRTHRRMSGRIPPGDGSIRLDT